MAIDEHTKDDFKKQDADELSKLSLEELWQLFPIILKEHQDCWTDWYKEELKILMLLLPESSRISHIGSTAVKGIWAKPIIDILAELPLNASLKQAKDTLCANGYICMSESNKRISLNKGYSIRGFEERVFHIHLRYRGDNDELYFRRYLSEHEDTAHEYEQLKLSLWKKFEHDRDAYTAAKSAFVLKITEKAKTEYAGC